MTTYSGFDSAASSSRSTSATGGQSLFSYATTKTGTATKFWGRYIPGKAGIADGLVKAEVDFIHSKGAKVLVIYDTPTSATVSGSYQTGVDSGNDAIRLARALSIPAGVAIYADIENGFDVHSPWLGGWADALTNSEYKGGYYCNTRSGSPFSLAYPNARNTYPNVSGMVLYTTQPSVTNGCTTAPSSYAPTALSVQVNGQTTVVTPVVWQFIENCENGLYDRDLANDTGYSLMW